MAFDVKELMIDITKAGPACFIETLGCANQISRCNFGCSIPPSCYYQTIPIHAPILVCALATYTCLDTIVTCGGTIYCAGSNEPTILFQNIGKETVAQAKAQLKNALREIEAQEKRLAKSTKK